MFFVIMLGILFITVLLIEELFALLKYAIFFVTLCFVGYLIISSAQASLWVSLLLSLLVALSIAYTLKFFFTNQTTKSTTKKPENKNKEVKYIIIK